MTLMSGFHDKDAGQDSGFSITGVLDFFEVAMRHWPNQVQRVIEVDRHAQMHHKVSATFSPASGAVCLPLVSCQVIVRTYLLGHEDCHFTRAPWDDWHPYTWKWFNWPWIR